MIKSESATKRILKKIKEGETEKKVSKSTARGGKISTSKHKRKEGEKRFALNPRGERGRSITKTSR